MAKEHNRGLRKADILNTYIISCDNQGILPGKKMITNSLDENGSVWRHVAGLSSSLFSSSPVIDLVEEPGFDKSSGGGNSGGG